MKRISSLIVILLLLVGCNQDTTDYEASIRRSKISIGTSFCKLGIFVGTDVKATKEQGIECKKFVENIYMGINR